MIEGLESFFECMTTTMLTFQWSQAEGKLLQHARIIFLHETPGQDWAKKTRFHACVGEFPKGHITFAFSVKGSCSNLLIGSLDVIGKNFIIWLWRYELAFSQF